MEFNPKYSLKDFTGRNLSNEKDLSKTAIHGSCFSQEKPDTHVFPEDMTGVTFDWCNLDNCFIPAGNTVLNCSTRRFCCQKDGEDWIITSDNKIVEPVNKKWFEMNKRSIDPASLSGAK